MKKFISLLDALSLVTRQSGRTSELIKECSEFLFNPLYREEQVGIIVHTYAHSKPLLSLFEDRFHVENRADFIRFYKSEYKIVNIENYNSIVFVSINSTYKLRGQRYVNFYFDTPELDLFSSDSCRTLEILQETLHA